MAAAPKDLTERELAELGELGISPQDAARQLAFLRRPPAFVELDRPCTPGDGVRVLGEEEAARLAPLHEQARLAGRLSLFVPASGAASRMFQSLVMALVGEKEPDPAFAQGLGRFAFHEGLRALMAKEGLDLDRLAADGHLARVLPYLLTAEGLSLGSTPKGLIPFHRYPGGETRTSFEEHLVEAADYVHDEAGLCRLHFTVAPASLAAFQELARRVVPRREAASGRRFKVEFSTQDRSTDTLAAELDGRPFRSGGRLLLRPGGHGALLGNLARLAETGADVVYIKNIDNVAVDRVKPLIQLWKRRLGGLLVDLQSEVFERAEALESGGTAALEEASRFIAREFGLRAPGGWSEHALKKWLFARLNRPLRVCGVVPNTGEPGGGPFWTRRPSGEVEPQIVERAQVDPDEASQQSQFAASTHFNPVDVVCALRRKDGVPFDLEQYADPAAVFVSRKAHDGRELKALERPGLWNGGMAEWNTVFVEVPLGTFHPVKTVGDLLRDGHQA